MPITHSVDEAGKVVYKLPNYIASHFRPIFYDIDSDPARFGIKDYRIKNMTLEQVFIAIGEEEIKQDELAAGESLKGTKVKMMDELPVLW